MNSAECRPFLIAGHPYQWGEGYRLQRIPDDQARCAAEILREGTVLRCHWLIGHAGSHQASKETR